jgi:DNA-binding IclR family transcriptional regulator
MTTPTVVEPIQAESTDGLSSIGRAARVLRALARTGAGEAGVTQIAREAALPKSTTHRVLAELTTEDLVTHVGSRYQLGPGWFAMNALKTSQWVDMVDRARVPLARLFERTSSTVHFGVLNGGEVLYLEKLTGRGGTAVHTRVGMQLPATCTGLGKALLAHATPSVVRDLTSDALPVRSRASITMPGLLLRQLEEVRRTGVAYDLEESQAGVFCAASPIICGREVVAAVSVTRFGTRGLAATDAQETSAAADELASWLEDGA